ncbi:hypothetical protein [Saccharospirillum sp.]|uniref:hypothetical protein n=1 Tax=Saccharospirillum sp. TaxID=2033801 RepID=UPI0034A01B54
MNELISPADQLTAKAFSRLLAEQGLSIAPEDQAAALTAAQHLRAQAEQVCAAWRAMEADDDPSV